jgi:hypothetical protein
MGHIDPVYRRLLSKAIFFPSGDRFAKPSKAELLVRRRGSVSFLPFATGFARYTSAPSKTGFRAGST